MQIRRFFTVIGFVLILCSATCVGVVASEKPLSKEASEARSAEILEERKSQMRELLKQEWDAHEFTNDEFRMKFWDTIYGPKEPPAGGRSLYISMHGGGGAPAKVNDGQWRNQKKLYTLDEGLYFVPRAPTDTWNLWHQDYMDDFLRKTIAAAVMFEGVNPDKVYITGFSAGGDGTFQMAPRMADHWAAAAMMAGHPGDAQAEVLRNLPFAIYMGGKDAAYERNSLARQWGAILDRLAISDEPGSYVHDVQIFEECGHWMNSKDSVGISWMAQFTRNNYPQKVAWIQDDVLRDNFYWIGVPEINRSKGAKIVASYQDQTINIEQSDSPVVIIGLNDQMVDLDKPVTVMVDGKRLVTKRFKRLASSLSQPLNKSPYSLDAPYPVLLKIERNANAKAGATVIQL